MQDDYEPYIDLWYRLNSKTTEAAALGKDLLARCEVTDEELELMFILDSVYIQYKNKVEAEKQAQSKRNSNPATRRRR